ncbi:hypothetical protein BpHYR1_049957 [Brachionus plicatilis]|uniref:Uncharacterized protein n=1 Tax=Brachionus plicatilis TaxID=10195 RepID=A0A3M7PAL2_BRAPC|nr:hypothetical protein BpHYR1_049957 [Brachionus plicatilis]
MSIKCINRHLKIKRQLFILHRIKNEEFFDSSSVEVSYTNLGNIRGVNMASISGFLLILPILLYGVLKIMVRLHKNRNQ